MQRNALQGRVAVQRGCNVKCNVTATGKGLRTDKSNDRYARTCEGSMKAESASMKMHVILQNVDCRVHSARAVVLPTFRTDRRARAFLVA